MLGRKLLSAATIGICGCTVAGILYAILGDHPKLEVEMGINKDVPDIDPEDETPGLEDIHDIRERLSDISDGVQEIASSMAYITKLTAEEHKKGNAYNYESPLASTGDKKETSAVSNDEE